MLETAHPRSVPGALSAHSTPDLVTGQGDLPSPAGGRRPNPTGWVVLLTGVASERDDCTMSRRPRPRWTIAAAPLVAFAVLVVFMLGPASSPAAARGPGVPGSPAVPLVAAAAAETAAAETSRWPWPIAPPILVSRGFLAPATPYSSGHRGIDLPVGLGADVRAPADAVVSFAGVVVDRPVLTLDVGDDVLVSFEPLEAVAGMGDRVARGQVVGHVSVGGHCGSECLHIGVRLRGAYVSPLLFFDRVPRAVLLPLS